MKKLVSLTLALMLCLSYALALAEVAPVDVVIDKVPFEYTIVNLEDVPYSYGVPKGWLQVALSQDDKEWGLVGSFEDPNGGASITVGYEEPGDDTLETRLTKMLTWKAFTNVALVKINGRSFISYAEPKAKTTSLVTLLDDLDQDPLMVRFTYSFAKKNEGTAELSQQIASLLMENAEDDAVDAGAADDAA